MKYLRRIIEFLFVTYGALLLISCSNNDIPTPTPEPEPEAEVTFVLKLKSTEIAEFKKIVGKEITDVAQGEAKTIIGKRIELITPRELQFDEDSLSIVKSHGIVEHYAIKWQKDELFLYSDTEAKWEYCGKRSEKDQFLLNTGLFSRLSENQQRKLYITGQDYALNTHDQVLADPEDEVTWLRLEFAFEK